MIDLRLVAGALALAALAAGCQAAQSPAGSVAPSAAPSAAGSSAAADTIPTLSDEQEVLEAGTYRIVNRLAGAEGELPDILITVPAGWSNFGGWALNKGEAEGAPVAVMFWDVDELYAHPCQWNGTLFDPGPTVEDLVQALVEVPLRNATEPVDVALDGYAGKYLEWSVPADSNVDADGNFVECDADGEFRDFKSWTGRGWGSNRYQQGAGQLDRLWIVDVEGARLVVDAFSMPSATAEDRQELEEVVSSIRFER